MLTVEQVRERARQLLAERDALPDPKDEAVPRKREQLIAEYHRLTAEYNAFHFAASEWINVERKMQPLQTYRDGLLAGRAKLEADLVTARAAYEEARKGGEHNARQERRKVDAIVNSIGTVEAGFGPYGRQPMLENAVASVTPNFVWLDYSLPYAERLISDLRERWLTTLARLGDTDAARALTLRKELWRIEEELANEHESESIKALAMDRKLLLDQLTALGEFASATDIVAVAA